MPKEKVVLFVSQPEDVFCILARTYLRGLNVAFTEVEIGGNRKLARMLFRETGQGGTPVVRIGAAVIHGFDPDRIDRVLAKHGVQIPLG